MAYPTTEAEVRKLLEGRLGHAVDGAIWGYLDEQTYPRLVVEGEETLEELAQQYHRLERLKSKGSADEAIQPGLRREPQHVEPDERLKALSRKLAQRAAEEPAVMAFRADVLGGQLLAPEHVAAWIDRQAQADGESTLYLGDVAVPPGHTVEHGHEGTWVEPPLTLSKESPARSAGGRFLVYAVPGEKAVFRVPVAHGGTLNRLRRLSESLAGSYSWQVGESDTGKARATLFVLTAEPPLIPRATITWHVSLGSPIEGRISFDLDPTLGPAAVAKLYRQARDQFPLRRRSHRYRPMTGQHAHLAEWADKEGSWRDRMEQWNQALTDPKWRRYTDWRGFARDVTRAARRLYGEEEQ